MFEFVKHLPPYLLLGSGAVIGYLRNVYQPFLNWVDKRVWMTLEVMEPSTTYHEVDSWLHTQKGAQKLKNVYARPTKQYGDTHCLVPGFGTSYIWRGRSLLKVTRTKTDSPGYSEKPVESLHIRILFGDLNGVRQILEEAEKCRKVLLKKGDEIYILTTAYGSTDWRKLDSRLRSLSSVVLPGTLAEDVLSDLRKFLTSEDWYDQMGAPYRRGVLLSGVPGSGKTSFISALARELKLPLYILNIGDKDLTDQALVYAISNIPKNSIVVMEDIDTAAPNREGTGEEQKVSLGTLLNVLDGFMATHGGIVFMTSNHPEKLDPALVRPGRVDVKVHFDYATQDQIARLYRKFNPDSYQAAALDYAKGYEGRQVCMCDVQQDLLNTSNRGQA